MKTELMAPAEYTWDATKFNSCNANGIVCRDRLQKPDEAAFGLFQKAQNNSAAS